IYSLSLHDALPIYFKSPSGGPLIQHSLVAALEFYHKGKIPLEKVVQKMCHNPALIFNVKDRGFIREGYYADLVCVVLNQHWIVSKENILAKCGWSPFAGTTFRSAVEHVFVAGHHAFNNGKFNEEKMGERLTFDQG